MQIMQVGYKDFIHLTYGIPQLHVYACGVCMWFLQVKIMFRLQFFLPRLILLGRLSPSHDWPDYL